MVTALLLAAAVTPEADRNLVTQLVEVADLSCMSPSPDGKTLVVRVARPSVASNSVRASWLVVSTSDPKSVREVDAGEVMIDGAGRLAEECPVWSPNSRAFYFRVARQPSVEVWRAPLTSEDPLPVIVEAGDVLSLRVDEHGRELVYTTSASHDELAARERVERTEGVRIDHTVDLAIGVSGGGWRLGKDVPIRTTGRWFERVSYPPADGSGPKTWELPESDRLDYAGPPTSSNVALDRSDSCVVMGPRSYCISEAHDQPPKLVMTPLTEGDASTIFDPNSQLRETTAGRVRSLTIPSGPYRLRAQLVIPAETRPLEGFPLVITYYSCRGFLRGGVGDELPVWPLAERGIATLCIEKAPITPSALTKRKELRTALSAVRSAIQTLSEDGTVDPTRVGMHGLSFGSEATMWIAGHSRLLAAASIASGQLEPAFYWTYAIPGRDAPETLRRFWGLGSPEASPAAWRSLSPAAWADRIQTPLLMQLPELEARWSMELFSKLARGRTPVELYAFPGAEHLKSQPAQKAAAYTRNLDWFRFWLSNKEDEDPTKEAQYRRWRDLRSYSHNR